MESVFSSTPIKVLSLNTQNAEIGYSDLFGEGKKNKNMATFLTDSGADIIALQECTANGVVANIKSKMSNASSFEVIEYDGIGPALIYNKEVFDCEEYGQWRLAEKGNEDNGEYQRDAVYAKLVRKEDGAVILAVSTHFDYLNDRAKAQAAKLIENLNTYYPGVRTVIMGDFNFEGQYGPFPNLESASFVNAQKIAETKVNEGAYTHKSSSGTEKVLDFIYLNGFKVTVHEVKTDLDGKSVSDHRPVYAEIVIK